ncbi:MAG: hypothetical protein K9G11_01800 [Rickettsiaceae bacterium]|nr:hypothetical protein [Rickettsiaceae bacterium]
MKNSITLIALILVAFLSSCSERSKHKPTQEALLNTYVLPEELQYKAEVQEDNQDPEKAKKSKDPEKAKKSKDPEKAKKSKDPEKAKGTKKSTPPTK